MKVNVAVSGFLFFFLFSLLLAASSPSIYAETVEVVTYYPATANLQDLHATSLTVGNDYLNTVLANGQALIQTSLGIGTNNPQQQLHLARANNDTALLVERTGANPSAVFLSAGADAGLVGTSSNDPFTLVTNNTARVTIQADGRLQVGASSLFVQNDQGGNLELGGSGAVANPVAGGTPYLDFHFGTGAAQDYNARIINSANNRLSFFTNADTITPALTVNGARIGIGTAAPQAALEINSTTSGFLPPRMTTDEKNAIDAPQEGMIVYDTTLRTLQIYDGLVWSSNGFGGAGGDTLISAEVAYKGTTASSITFSKPSDARYAIVKVMGGANGANVAGGAEDAEFMHVLLDFSLNRSTGTHMWVGGNGNSYMFNYGWRNSPFGARVTVAVGETTVGAYNAVTRPQISATATTVTFSSLSANPWDQSYWVLYYR